MASWTYDLAVSVEPQAQTEWCWAAVALGVSEFFDPTTTWTQCRIVCTELQDDSCCADGSTTACNQPGSLEQALAITGNLQGAATPPLSQDEVAAELAAGRPVCARIGWRDGGAHFVAITAVDTATNRLLIQDPETKSADSRGSDWQYDAFRDNYRARGEWTNSFLTQAASANHNLLGGAGPPSRGATPPVPPGVAEALHRGIARFRSGALRARTFRKRSRSARDTVHDVYFGSLNGFAGDDGLQRAIFVGWRRLHADASGVASSEVNVTEDGRLTAAHVTAGPHAIGTALELKRVRGLGEGGVFFEVRYLRIPAVHIAALWLKHPDDARDVIIPLAPVPHPIVAGKRYARSAFEEAVRPLARRRQSFDEPQRSATQ